MDLGQALKLIGGAPHMKVGSVIAEKFPITKMMSGGPLGGTLAKVLQDGPGAIMQNPLGAVSGQLQGAITGAVGQLSGVSGATGLVTALTGSGGLSQAIGSLSQSAGLLSGSAMPGAGQFGLLDAITHTSITDMLGDQVPASLGLDRVLGPLHAGGTVGAIASALPTVIQGVVGGQITADAAIGWVTAAAASLKAVTDASATALQTAQDAAVTLVTVSSAAAATASTVPEIQAILPLILKPGVQDTMQAAVATHVAA
ncbi:MAG: hypothetical protein K2Y56_24105 [Methylobacterium sp.]|nr:hypothetical protein [Methylobacterium sp.]